MCPYSCPQEPAEISEACPYKPGAEDLAYAAWLSNPKSLKSFDRLTSYATSETPCQNHRAPPRPPLGGCLRGRDLCEDGGVSELIKNSQAHLPGSSAAGAADL